MSDIVGCDAAHCTHIYIIVESKENTCKLRGVTSGGVNIRVDDVLCS